MDSYQYSRARLQEVPETLRRIREAVAHHRAQACSDEHTQRLCLQDLQYQILSWMGPLAGYNEAYWHNTSWSHDGFMSRRLPHVQEQPLNRGSRVAPGDLTHHPLPPVVPDTVADPAARHARRVKAQERVRKFQDDYDFREAAAMHLRPRMVLRSRGSTEPSPREQHLSLHHYYDTVRVDQLARTLQELLRAGLHASALMVYGIMAAAPVYAHLVLQREVVEVMFAEAPQRYQDPRYLADIHYSLHYALRILDAEESAVCYRSTSYHRFWLNPTVLEMIPRPTYPLEQHPYVMAAVGPEELYHRGNPLMPIHSARYRGFYSLEVFRLRLSVFAHGQLDDLPLDRLVVCGSCVPACLIRNPLETTFGLDPSRSDMEYWRTQTEALRRYFDEYYPSKAVIRGWEGVSEETLGFLEDELSDIDLVSRTQDHREFDRLTWRLHQHLQQYLRPSGDDGSAPPPDIRIYRKTTTQNYKYYLGGTSLPRSYEIFRIQSWESVEAGVSRFHFPVVRCMYDGRLAVTASCWAYAMSGVMTNYRWFSMVSKCANTMVRYCSRGAFTALNSSEREEITRHVTAEPMWNSILRYREMGSNHPVFHPRMWVTGMYIRLRDLLSPGMSLVQGGTYTPYEADTPTGAWPAHLSTHLPRGQALPWKSTKLLHHMGDYVFSRRLEPRPVA